MVIFVHILSMCVQSVSNFSDVWKEKVIRIKKKIEVYDTTCLLHTSIVSISSCSL